MILPGLQKSPIIGRKVILLDQVESTNSLVKQWALAGEEEGLTVIAKEQSAGRGRWHRVWFSPGESGLYLSILLRPGLTAADSGALSVMLSLAAVKAIRSAARLRVTIKWPNDILFEGRKLCGILVENHLIGGLLTFAAAGIGLNVNQEIADFPLGLRLKSTSLRIAAGRPVEMDLVTISLLRHLNLLYPRLHDMKMRHKWVRVWQQHCGHMQQPVTVSRGTERMEGLFRGINSSGAALVELETGETLQLESGEFSLREK
ncbi:MAG TPA: biotin--[acetyl-CoA-carboxylase] ligase [bacterium]|nr:biotin--[acetyl-CoA-carboxylase] ligase [bacterium]